MRLPQLKPTPRSKLAKRLLTQPWIGPAISLIVLSVSLVSLGVAIASLLYNKSGYDRQTAQLRAEDDNRIQLQLHIQSNITSEGFRTAYIQLYFVPTNPLRLESVSFTEPPGVSVKVDPKIAKWDSASSSLLFDQTLGISSQLESGIAVEFLIRTPKTPLNDQNSVVQMTGEVSELVGDKRHFKRMTRAVIPSDAKR